MWFGKLLKFLTMVADDLEVHRFCVSLAYLFVFPSAGLSCGKSF